MHLLRAKSDRWAFCLVTVQLHILSSSSSSPLHFYCWATDTFRTPADKTASILPFFLFLTRRVAEYDLFLPIITCTPTHVDI